MTSPNPLPAPGPCPECGGTRVYYNVGPEIVAYSSEAARTFDNQRHFRMCVCTNCGYAAFYVENPGVPLAKQQKPKNR